MVAIALHYMLLNENELDSSLSYQAYATSVAKSGTYFTELEFYIASELLGIVIGVINASGIVTWSPSNPAIDIHLLIGRDIVFIARVDESSEPLLCGSLPNAGMVLYFL